MTSKRMLTVGYVARDLEVSGETVRAWIRAAYYKTNMQLSINGAPFVT